MKNIKYLFLLLPSLIFGQNYTQIIPFSNFVGNNSGGGESCVLTIKPGNELSLSFNCSFTPVNITSHWVADIGCSWYIPDMTLGYVPNRSNSTTCEITIVNKKIYISASSVPESSFSGIINKFYLYGNFPPYITNNATKQNYIKTTEYLTESDEAGLKRINMTFFDGLGRNIQSVAVGQAGNGRNIVTPIAYDQLGRQEKEYLPYVTPSLNIEYYPHATNDVLNYSNYVGDIPYSQKQYDNSPLNRVLEQGAPGNDWSIGNPNKHTIRYDYQTNDINEVRKYKVVFHTNTTESHNLEVDGYYTLNSLYKKVTKNENWVPNPSTNDLLNTSQEFVDKSGKTILKRTFNFSSTNDSLETLNTYYVYDIYGNLSYVIPPTASEAIDLVYNTSANVNRNYPWTKMAQVDEDLALQYNKIFSDYKNEFIANADLLAKYGGQGGFSLSTNSNNELLLSIDINTNDAMELRTGEILSLKELGDFKDAELGRISGENYKYIFTIKNNSLVVSGNGKINTVNIVFNGATKLVYNKNYPWSSLVDIDPKEAVEYNRIYNEMDNASILTAEIDNPYGAIGGINVLIDENDVVGIDINITNTTPLKLKKGITIPLETERKIADTEIGVIELEGLKYLVSVKENSLFIEGEGSFTNLNASRATTTPPAMNVAIPPAVIDGLCYIYMYDYRNRLVEKKIPGKGWEYMVYDQLDRLVLTQDANLRLQNQWLFTKYDVFSRPIYTGQFTFYTANTNSLMRKQVQNLVTTMSSISESRNSTGFQNGGLTINYTQAGYPNSSNYDYKVYTVNYYDDYNFQPPSGAAIQIPTSVTHSDLSSTNILTNVKELSTGSLVRILDTNQWTLNLTAYDTKSRPIWTNSQNLFLQTSDVTQTQLDFIGKVIETKTTHSKTGAISNLITVNKFKYDFADRLLKHTQTIGNNPEELIAFNQYDELGRLVQKKVGNAYANQLYVFTPALQTIDYSYNIRGWLKSINNPDQSLASPNLFSDLFSFKINYNTPQLGANPLYNGNISETSWRCKFDDEKRNYKYSYDELNRIIQADFDGNHYVNGYLENYNEEGISYDKNGNILSLTRYGLTSNNTISIIDQLVYSYPARSNKLSQVIDYGNQAGFLDDGVNATDDYSYDINGNMKTDLNKGIINIDYNYLNLPTRIDFSTSNATGKYVQYFYDATGVKQRKIIQREGIPGTTVTDYSGNYVYENNTLQFISHPEGYVSHSNNTFSYVYQYKDHLGNIRLSYKKNNSGQLDIIENNDYYPFGLKLEGYNITQNLGNVVAQKYKYNGKEYQDELGLNIYDYGARNYDPALGRWMNVDPLAETSRRYSPYAYALDNPVYYIDPDGMSAKDNFYFDRNGNLTRRAATNAPDRFFVEKKDTPSNPPTAVTPVSPALDGTTIAPQLPKYDEIKLNSDLGHMARTVYAEGAGQSKDSKVALAEVIRNRAEDTTKSASSNNYNAQFSDVSTYEAVVTQPTQFQAVSTNQPRYTDPLSVTGGNGIGPRNELETNKLTESVGASIQATMQNTDTAQGATYFYSPYIPAPSWTKSMEQVTVSGVSTGDFRFYKY
jgi:RHS repeat-associated protein